MYDEMKAAVKKHFMPTGQESNRTVHKNIKVITSAHCVASPLSWGIPLANYQPGLPFGIPLL